MEDMPEAFINYNGETLREVPDEILDYYISLEAEDIPDTIPDWMS